MSAAPIEAASLPWYGSHATKAAESSWPNPRNGSASIGIGSGGNRKKNYRKFCAGATINFGYRHLKQSLVGSPVGHKIKTILPSQGRVTGPPVMWPYSSFNAPTN